MLFPSISTIPQIADTVILVIFVYIYVCNLKRQHNSIHSKFENFLCFVIFRFIYSFSLFLFTAFKYLLFTVSLFFYFFLIFFLFSALLFLPLFFCPFFFLFSYLFPLVSDVFIFFFEKIIEIFHRHEDDASKNRFSCVFDIDADKTFINIIS